MGTSLAILTLRHYRKELAIGRTKLSRIYHCQRLRFLSYLQAHLAIDGMSNEQDGSLERVPSDHIGPEYRSLNEKPKATVSKTLDLDNLQVLPQTPQLIALLT